LLLALFMYELIDVRPSFMFGDPVLEGYVCDIDGHPVENGVVDAVGSLGEPVSVTEVTTDDTGYFILQVDSWAQRPRNIRLSGVASCHNTLIPISSSFLSDRCPGETRPLPPRERAHIWRPQCTITQQRRP
jgi:hypothetical protein